MQISASSIYALSQGRKNKGELECHWCGAPCDRTYIHDDVVPMPFIRSQHPCKRAANAFICVGCWLWKRKRLTIDYYSGEFKDGQCPENHSWLITEKNAFGIRTSGQDMEKLYSFLVKPAGSFSLSFLTGDKKPRNYIQLMIGNDLSVISADTPIFYTINNVPFTYTIYELEEAIKQGSPEGTEPGVGALFSIYPPPFKQNHVIEVPRKRGRPPKNHLEEEEDSRKVERVVFRSGTTTTVS